MTGPPGWVCRHVPVLVHEVVRLLVQERGGKYIDATVGAGGHALALLQAAGGEARLLGMDADSSALEVARETLSEVAEQAALVHGSFRELGRVAEETEFARVNGVLFDLGLSSMQLADRERGFSIRGDGRLDMRFDCSRGVTAEQLVNELDEAGLAAILRDYGEERFARRIAAGIVRARPVRTAAELADVVAAAVPRRKASDSLARTFQAIRIAVNDELSALEEGLGQATGLLAPGGRLAVISFHSLEDRIVKRFLRRESTDCLCPPDLPVCVCNHVARLRVLTRRPITPGAEEVQTNPRSRSAKLRAGERI